MLSRSVIARQAQRAARSSWLHETRRGLAAPASGSFSYETGDAQGIKVASRDQTGPVTTLALVAKAGTRYQPLPGLTQALQRFAFKVRWMSMDRLERIRATGVLTGLDTVYREPINPADTARS